MRDELCIGAVVNLQDDPDLAGKGLRLRDLEHAYRQHRLRLHRVPIADGDNAILLAQIDRAVALVHAELEAGHRLYLHCNAGMNRAPTIAIAHPARAPRPRAVSSARLPQTAPTLCAVYDGVGGEVRRRRALSRQRSPVFGAEAPVAQGAEDGAQDELCVDTL